MNFGIQTALQNTTPDEVRAVWVAAEHAGYDWISIWDHFVAVGGGTNNLEAISMHAALALSTRQVRCGGLVYSVGYRDVAVLANAMATVDHLSGGRVTLGLGAGYMAHEYEMWGIPFPTPRHRLDRLEETVAALRGLFAGKTVSTEGEHVRLRNAVCDPPPLQERLPVWIGGGGERRTIPMAARLADGWNVPMATLDDFERKCRVLRDAAADAGRDPSAIEASVGLGLCWDPAQLDARFGARAEAMRPTILSGSTDEVIHRVAGYGDAGADRILLSLRAPFAIDEVHRFAEEVIPAL